MNIFHYHIENGFRSLSILIPNGSKFSKSGSSRIHVIFFRLYLLLKIQNDRKNTNGCLLTLARTAQY